MSDAKIAMALATIDRQANLLQELRSYASDQAKTAAALAQAVKLASDGLIDVSDIAETARRLKADGNVKMSSADEVFRDSPGTLEENTDASGSSKLDPLTRELRQLRSINP